MTSGLLPSSAAATARMMANRRRDTGPERRLRSELHRRGQRFRVDYSVSVPGVRGRPDIVFPRKRLAVYVDGCFWHRCPIHGTAPRANQSFWEHKLNANVERDRNVTARLEAVGWHVVRVWEHMPVEDAADLVVAALKR